MHRLLAWNVLPTIICSKVVLEHIGLVSWYTKYLRSYISFSSRKILNHLCHYLAYKKYNEDIVISNCIFSRVVFCADMIGLELKEITCLLCSHAYSRYQDCVV